MSPEDKQKLDELYEFMQDLKNNASIPLEVGTAFRERLKDIGGLEVSPKDVDSEDIIVDESGSSQKTLLGDPDLFLKVTVAGTTYHLPAYT